MMTLLPDGTYKTCDVDWLSHGCSLDEGHGGDHLCLIKNYVGGEGARWIPVLRMWCPHVGTLDFYDLCDYRSQEATEEEGR